MSMWTREEIAATHLGAGVNGNGPVGGGESVSQTPIPPPSLDYLQAAVEGALILATIALSLALFVYLTRNNGARG